ncbi:serine proteinase [Pilatotrama ljubarskyi]|nr:serine proteinase [Pilatotrama ljubarskyi]
MSSGGSPQKLVDVRVVEGHKKENSYIVHLKDDVDKARYLRQLKGQLGANSTVEFDYPSGFANAFAGTFEEESLNIIRASSEVESIYEDAIGSIFVGTVQEDAVWNLNRMSQHPKLPFRYTYDDAATGKDVDIYIMDTGVNVDHVDFGGRASWGWVRPGLPQADDHGHGTQVASIAAGTHLGVAKEASIIAVKTHDQHGEAPASVIFDAMGWIWNHVQETKRPSIVNMSFGFCPPEENIDKGVKELTDHGIHICAAAGNSASDAANVSPARCATAITVGASNVDDARLKTSNYGAVLTVFAPGDCIKAATIGSQTAVTYDSGTSFASPLVAGLVAYFISLAGNVSPEEMMGRVTHVALQNVLTDIPDGTPNLLANNGN